MMNKIKQTVALFAAQAVTLGLFPVTAIAIIFLRFSKTKILIFCKHRLAFILYFPIFIFSANN